MLSEASRTRSSQAPVSFLREVASDDGLRVALESDPVATLGEWGLQVAADQIPEEITLPSTAALKQALVECQATGDSSDERSATGVSSDVPSATGADASSAAFAASRSRMAALVCAWRSSTRRSAPSYPSGA